MVLVPLAALALVAPAWPGTEAAASWGATGTGTARASSSAMAAPGTASASCGLLLQASVKVDWSASATPWVTQYEVRYGTNPSSPTQSALVSGLTYTSPALGLGTWYFTVRAAQGSWRSATSNQVSRTVVSVIGLGVLCA